MPPSIIAYKVSARIHKNKAMVRHQSTHPGAIATRHAPSNAAWGILSPTSLFLRGRNITESVFAVRENYTANAGQSGYPENTAFLISYMLEYVCQSY